METEVVSAKTTLFVIAIVALCLMVTAFIVTISIVRPAADNTPLILTVLGTVGPVITALLAATVQQLHLAVNSRLTQLLVLTAKASKAEGQLVGIATTGNDLARGEGKAAGVEQERQRAAGQSI